MAEFKFKRKRRPSRTKSNNKSLKFITTQQSASAPAFQPNRELGKPYIAGPLYGLAAAVQEVYVPDDGDLERARVEEGPDEQTTKQQKENVESDISRPDAGKPLDPVVRRKMEHRFGRDLGHIRIHTGAEAEKTSESLNARAFTHRRHIWLGKHTSPSDQKVLAHEITHVVQQGQARPLNHRRPISLSKARHPTAKRTQTPSVTPVNSGSHPVVQRISLWGIARSVGGAVVSGVRSVARGAAGVVQGVMELGRDALLAIVRRVAPDFLRLFQRGGITSFLRDMLGRGLRTLFGGPLGSIRRIFNIGNLGGRFSQVANWFSTIAGQLARNDCSGIISAAQRFGNFMSRTFEPVVERVRSIARAISEFFSGVWDAVGMPVIRLLRRIGGTVWETIRSFISDVGRVIRRVREALGAAWTRVKDWFGIGVEDGTEEGGGLWNWIKDKARRVWDSIKESLQPIMGPLRVVGGVLVAISPAGPVLAAIAAWPYLRQAFQWVREQWRDLNLVVRAREFFANTVLPAVVSAASRVGDALVNAADWLLGMLGRVAAGVQSVTGRVAGGILAPLARIINFVSGQFQRLVEWARSGLRYAATNARSLFQRLIQFIQPVIDVLRRLIAIAVNPFGIPGLLMGTLWSIIPNCLKGPVINFIIDIIIRVLRMIPPLPQLGILWPFIRSGILGFLERVRSFAVERKVAVSNKIANIISGGSASFAFGYLRGLVLGVWEAIIGPFRAIIDIFRLPSLIRNLINRLGIDFSELMTQVRAMAASVTERAVGTFDSLVEGARDLISNPGRIIDLIRSAIQAALSAVRSLGASIANRMMALFEGSDEQIGESLGRLVGEALIQIVLAVFTAGSSTAVSAIGGVLRVLGTIGRNVMRVVRVVGRLIPRFLRFIRRMGGMFRRAGSRAGGILGRIRQFFRRIVQWLQRAMRRVRRRFRRRGGRGRRGDRRLWRQFRRAVRSDIRPYRSQGIRKKQLRPLFRSVRSRFARIARYSLRPIRKDDAYWTLWARKRGRLFSTRVGRVLMDRDTRWRAGRKAVLRAIRRLKRRPGNISSSDIMNAIRNLRRRFQYKSLSVVFQQNHNVFKVQGTMSNGDDVASTAPELNDVNVLRPMSTGVEIDNLAYRGRRSRASGNPTYWDEVRKIKTPTGRTTAYIKGHLVSGWFARGVSFNLTPIRRSTNALMAVAMETPLRTQLPTRASVISQIRLGRIRDLDVFKYRVNKVGKPSQDPPERDIIGKPGERKRIPEEKELPRKLTMTLTRKRYNDSAKRWVDSNQPVAGVPDSHEEDNVPPYPPGSIRESST